MQWHRSFVRFLAFVIVCLLSGCATPEEQTRRIAEEQEAKRLKALEARRRSKMSTGEAGSARGAEVMVPDESRTFNPATARFGNTSSLSSKSAQTGEFRFVDGVRTKEFSSGEYRGAKTAWLEKLRFTTKEARTGEAHEAREAGKTARSKGYETDAAREAGKSAAIPVVADGTRKFMGKEADRFTRGIRPEDQAKYENPWNGNLEPMSIEDVKKLLNKN